MTAVRCVAIAVVAALLLVPVAMPRLTGHGLLVVDGGSMSPTYRVGDILVTDAPTGDDLHPGGVVVIGAGSRRYTHRVVGLDDSGTRARLQGDANATPDPGWVSQDDVEAVPVARVHGATAWIVRILTGPPGRLVLVLLATLLIRGRPHRRACRPRRRRSGWLLR